MGLGIIMGNTRGYRYKDETGNRYGKLTVLSFVRTNKLTSFWKCLCDCGKSIITRGNTLRSGQVKSCGKCNIFVVNEESVFKRRWRSIKSGARKRKLIVEITYEDFKEMAKLPCYYCRTEPTKSWIKSRAVDADGNTIVAYADLHGLDRLDSTIGYTIENVVTCCLICNRMKSDLSVEQFYRKVSEIYEYNQKTGNYTKSS